MMCVMVIFQHDILSMILCLHVRSSSPRAETADEKVIKKLSKNVLVGGVIPFFQSVRVHISWSVFGSVKQYLLRLCSWWHLHYAAFEARDSTPQTGFTCVLFCRLGACCGAAGPVPFQPEGRGRGRLKATSLRTSL